MNSSSATTNPATTDLVQADALKDLVREKYSAIAEQSYAQNAASSALRLWRINFFDKSL